MTHDEFTFQLNDGTHLLVRPIRAEDKPLLVKGLEELSPDSRYRRFFRHIDHLNESQLRYLTEVDFVTHSALVCVRADAPSEGVGVARWISDPAEEGVAEAAITVIDRYQGRGVGRELLYLLSRDALSKGVHAFRAWVFGDNQAILRILRQAGAPPPRWEWGVAELTVPLPATVEELDETAAPTILKAVAAGALEARPSEQIEREGKSSR